MRKLLIILAIAVTPALSHAKANLEFRVSKTHGYINFIQTVMGSKYRSQALREYFEKSIFNTPENQKAIADIKTTWEVLNNGYNFSGYPQGRNAGQNLEGFLLIQSAFAESLDDLSERMTGLLPISEHKKLFTQLRTLLPVYDALIWDPMRDKLEVIRVRMKKSTTQWGIDQLFDQAMKFYRSDWPEEMPFTIALYPIPGASGHTTAESDGSFESVGILVDKADLTVTFGVLFHELCHSLYQAQSAEVQKELAQQFLTQPSRHAAHAYGLLNEAVATALGNGIAYEKAAGKPDEGEWYNDRFIDGFGKALTPFVKTYLAESRSIDTAFAARATQILVEKFPDLPYEYQNLMRRIVVAVSQVEGAKAALRSALNSQFTINRLNMHTPIVSTESLDQLKSTSDTRIFAVIGDEQPALKRAAADLPFLQQNLEILTTTPGEWIFSKVDEKGQAWIVIRVSEPGRFDAAIRALLAAKKINPQVPLTRF